MNRQEDEHLLKSKVPSTGADKAQSKEHSGEQTLAKISAGAVSILLSTSVAFGYPDNATATSNAEAPAIERLEQILQQLKNELAQPCESDQKGPTIAWRDWDDRRRWDDWQDWSNWRNHR